MKHSFALTAMIALPLLACSSSNSASDTTQTPSQQMAAGDIIDVAASDAQFKTLVTAIKAAGLVDALKGDGPFTVFAPTDAAFAKLPAGTLDALLADTAKLQTILKYHVVSGAVSSSKVVTLASAPTLQGSSVNIDASQGVRINNATVIKADVPAKNGVIHVIDTVLMPQ